MQHDAALMDMQVAEPKPVNQVSLPATCRVASEPAQCGSEVGPPVSGSQPSMVSEAMPVEACELVWVKVVQTTRAPQGVWWGEPSPVHRGGIGMGDGQSPRKWTGWKG